MDGGWGWEGAGEKQCLGSLCGWFFPLSVKLQILFGSGSAALWA